MIIQQEEAIQIKVQTNTEAKQPPKSLMDIILDD